MITTSRFLGIAAGLALAGSAVMADSISPDAFEATLEVGESVTITKTVTVDAGTLTTGKVDIFFLADTTGSMGGYINTVRNYANDIFSTTESFGDVAWGVGEYKDFTDSFTWRLNQEITQDTAALSTGLNQWRASGGGDYPEANLEGLVQTANNPDVGWRDDSSRFVVWFGDAPGHDPVSCADQGISGCTAPARTGYPGPTLTDTLAALDAQGITVFGVGSSGFDDYGQVSVITDATGGDMFLSGNPGAAIIDLIRNAIDETFATYSSVSLAAVGDLSGIDVDISDAHVGDFDRSETRTFEFDVTFTALEEGLHEFSINALVDRNVVGTEHDTFHVKGGAAVVPLPAGGLLLLSGLGGLALLRRRRAA